MTHFKRMALVLIVSACIAVPAQASGLTSAQVSAILGLLSSFGVDQSTYQTVSAILNSQDAGAIVPDCVISDNLSPGSSGTGVSCLQQLLAQTGDYTYGQATGYYGSVTQAAVQRYQAREGIVSSGDPQSTGYGAVGARTRAALNESLSVSSSRSAATGSGSGASSAQTPSQNPSIPASSPIAVPGTDSAPATAPSATSGDAATAGASPYLETAIRVGGSYIPAYPTPDGLIGFQLLSAGTLTAYGADGGVRWTQSTTAATGLSGGGDINMDGYPDLVLSGWSGTGQADSSWGEIRSGKTGALLGSLAKLSNNCPNNGTVSYCQLRWFVGSVLFGGGTLFAEVPQYWGQGWFMQGSGSGLSTIAAYYTSLTSSFDTYAAAHVVGDGLGYAAPDIPDSMVQNGLLVQDSSGAWRLVAFTSGRVLQYQAGALSTNQLISDTTLVTGNRPDTGGRNYGLVTHVGRKVILIAGTDASSLRADAIAGARTTDPWASLARHVAIFDMDTATVQDRFYSWAHDSNDAAQYINRVTYPSHPVVSVNGTPYIFFNVFDGTNWYVSVNDLSLREVARIPNTYLWDTIARTDGSRRFVISKTSGYWPSAPHQTLVAQYASGAFSAEQTLDGLPLMAYGLKTPDITSSTGLLSYVLVGPAGVLTDSQGGGSSPSSASMAESIAPAARILPTAALSFDQSSYAPGAPMTISWTNGDTSLPKDWIGLASSAGDWSSTLGAEGVGWEWSNGRSAGSITLAAPSTPGTYDAVFYASNTGSASDRTASGRASFSVVAPVSQTSTVSTDAPVYSPGAPVTVQWYSMQAPGTKDWVAIGPHGGIWGPAYGAQGVSWQWTNGAVNGSATLVAPATPGTYDAVYYRSNSGDSTDRTVVARASITVQ